MAIVKIPPAPKGIDPTSREFQYWVNKVHKMLAGTETFPWSILDTSTGDIGIDDSVFTLDQDDTGGNVDLVFGLTVAKYLRHTGIQFQLNDDLQAENFISTIAIGTSPFACTSTTLNTNLNADLLDGLHASEVGSVVDHSSLLDLLSDDHTQYALLLGRTGGQTLIGGTASGDDLTLQSTSNITKGSILFGTSVYDEVNNRLGIGTIVPEQVIDIASNGNFLIGAKTDTTQKAVRFLVQPYTLANADMQAFRARTGVAAGAANNIEFGGGASDSTAATNISFYTAIDIDTMGVGTTMFSCYTASNIEFNPNNADIDIAFNGDTSDNILHLDGNLETIGIGGVGVSGQKVTIYSNGGVYFRDSAIAIYSQADTFLDLFADGAVRIGNSSAGAPTTYIAIEPDGSTFWTGEGSGVPYGSMYTNTSITVTIAAADTWYEVDINTPDFTVGEINMVTFTDHYLVVTKAGRYKINFAISMTTSNAQEEVAGAIAINGTATEVAHAHSTVVKANASIQICGNAIIDLAANDQISLAVQNHDSTASIVISHASITIEQVGGT